jgi:probable phosphoglycerate mutase
VQKTHLCLVRHGETAWNAEGRVQGQHDVPLSSVGLSQARCVASALCGERFDAIYSSDLGRVTQTAEPLARLLDLPLRLDPRLRERHYGFFQTLTYAEVKLLHPEDYARFLSREPGYDFRSGESLQAFYDRSIACLADIASRHPAGSVLVFTHGGVLEMAYRFARGLGLRPPRDFRIPNAALNRLAIDGDTWSVLRWADCAHLETALDDLPG